MPLTILDAHTGTRVTVKVPVKPQPIRRIRRWIRQELDQMEINKKPSMSRA